jgi:hypothetical protein
MDERPRGSSSLRRSQSMMWINQLRWAREPRAAQPDLVRCLRMFGVDPIKVPSRRVE